LDWAVAVPYKSKTIFDWAGLAAITPTLGLALRDSIHASNLEEDSEPDPGFPYSGSSWNIVDIDVLSQSCKAMRTKINPALMVSLNQLLT
jgi:hypothetical protein